MRSRPVLRAYGKVGLVRESATHFGSIRESYKRSLRLYGAHEGLVTLADIKEAFLDFSVQASSASFLPRESPENSDIAMHRLAVDNLGQWE